jgi:hypothetical protein
MSIFSYTNGITFLTTAQVRQIGQAIATAVATNYVSTTIGTITVSTPTTRGAMPWETAAPVPWGGEPAIFAGDGRVRPHYQAALSATRVSH